MSAPLVVMTVDDLDNLSAALQGFAAIRLNHGVEIGGHSSPEITVGDTVLRVQWDDEGGQYVINDSLGG